MLRRPEVSKPADIPGNHPTKLTPVAQRAVHHRAHHRSKAVTDNLLPANMALLHQDHLQASNMEADHLRWAAQAQATSKVIRGN